ncbi:phage terminase small subunit-related protein [Paraclostridium bifermentans]|uniref:Phage terminase small subunit-related protein n=1 Tax=Paraclostridium bifermentans TaxID=1490 RepID=A0ABY8R0N8_PARBF|nr:phage terminase small subunit-related protein [Paraclostridium bifermentans]
MARVRSPNRDKAYDIYKEHNGNIDLVEIANTLGISAGTVRGWKNKDSWESQLNGTFHNNKERSKKKKAVSQVIKMLLVLLVINMQLRQASLKVYSLIH